VVGLVGDKDHVAAVRNAGGAVEQGGGIGAIGTTRDPDLPGNGGPTVQLASGVGEEILCLSESRPIAAISHKLIGIERAGIETSQSKLDIGDTGPAACR